ncbi:phosphosulfolactate synthase [Halothermothrix orenii]|uniref:Phosphosulfolactate synthase n=1 Tax=Halothermothrix orenii (strain H 168 / OCM 544 / DSM 9562) TaxID=373903 RepID=B8D0I9_HALOH|nr:phosphosulfolactate synthase [Halothermothrix orenii]ACL70925.1 Phosphosulfolactate synthase [Halothermothrix orenii H 168]
MDDRRYNGWELEMDCPIEGRVLKPRHKGVTMVLDKGLGIRALKDLLEIAGDYIDFLKFSFGTSFVYPHDILIEKIKLARLYGIEVFPGGTLFEVAASQGKVNEFLFRAKQLGFTTVEISNGTFDIGEKLRQESIIKASSLGFKVLTEVGKKDRNNPLTLEEMKTQIKEDIENGATKVIIEGRESGKGISIYRDDGSIDMKMLEGIVSSVPHNLDVIIWEAPLKKQQAVLINQFGPNVNLGNIRVDEVIALEALRRGLRGDTFKSTLPDEGKEGEERMIGA